ncbi:zinc-dependent peptidase [Hylemonella sp. W303a]|uniref:M90 family metallopeptidase n=1 Tax=Hylemonella sp. W303a TaxID=3389873 RepID=UPI00396B36C9
MGWLGSLLRRLLSSSAQRRPRRTIPDALWQNALAACPWLDDRTQSERARLRELCALFLEDKEFHGANGLNITDAMAVQIAAQACLPVLGFGTGSLPLRWYDDFVTIVVQPEEVLAPRTVVDENGVVHEYEEELAGEAMPEGPVMVSWQDVRTASDAEAIAQGYNVVIHEFVHKLDLRDGVADGCPPLPSGFMGLAPRAARQHWQDTLEAAYDDFKEACIRADRFGAAETWLDPYGAEHISEFFAVASEAYFVNRARFTREHPTLLALFDAFYRPGA